MNIYLDESYNLDRRRGKQCISINGFAVLDDKLLRKRWKNVRKKFASKRRIHAIDSYFEPLRKKGIDLLGNHDVSIISVFQLVQDLSLKHFSKGRLDFEKVYIDLVQTVASKLSLGGYRTVRIIIDARSHAGGKLGSTAFQRAMERHLQEKYPNTVCVFRRMPSTADVLIELADFVSNTFYRAYQADEDDIFSSLGVKLIKIKNPL